MLEQVLFQRMDMDDALAKGMYANWRPSLVRVDGERTCAEVP